MNYIRKKIMVHSNSNLQGASKKKDPLRKFEITSQTLLYLLNLQAFFFTSEIETLSGLVLIFQKTSKRRQRKYLLIC